MTEAEENTKSGKLTTSWITTYWLANFLIMSVIGSVGIIGGIAGSQRGGKPLSEKDIPSWYLKLATDVARTSFNYQEHRHKLIETDAATFDAWIGQYFDEFKHVDRAIWSKFHRWRIVNELLEDGFLVRQQQEDGSILLMEAASTADTEDTAAMADPAEASAQTADQASVSA
jgi:hypothetical protein